ncbi:MAG: hypothetical protein R3F05_14570 [Planctomycetota bacterium]
MPRGRDRASRLPPLPRSNAPTVTWFGTTFVALWRTLQVWVPWGIGLLVVHAAWDAYELPTLSLSSQEGTASVHFLVGPWLLVWTMAFALASATVPPSRTGGRASLLASSKRALRAWPYAFLPACALAVLPFLPGFLVVRLGPRSSPLVTAILMSAAMILGFALAGMLLMAPVAAARRRLGPLAAVREAFTTSRGLRRAISLQVFSWILLLVPVGAILNLFFHALGAVHPVLQGAVSGIPMLVACLLLAYGGAVIYEERRSEATSEEADDLGEVFA